MAQDHHREIPDLDMRPISPAPGPAIFSWCGFAVAYCLAKSSDIRPPFGAHDVDKFLWADSWRTEKFGQVPDIVQPVTCSLSTSAAAITMITM